jgi:hypothetical protein
MVIRRFGVWSVARLSGAVYGGIGLLIGIIVALLSLVAAGAASAFRTADTPFSSFMPSLFGIGAIIFLPIMYGVLGLIAGALTAWLYNLFAEWVGGVEMDVQ